MINLRQAAQQALDILDSEFTTVNGEFCRWCDGRLNAKHNCKLEQTITALRAALEEYDKDRVKVEEMKANWALQRKLAEETQERDKQQREYEEQRLAALAEPVKEPWVCACGANLYIDAEGKPRSKA